jgi:DNA-binding CsgD family transcriptional regulator
MLANALLRACHEGPEDMPRWIAHWSRHVEAALGLREGFVVGSASTRDRSLRMISGEGRAMSAFAGVGDFLRANPDEFDVAYGRPIRVKRARQLSSVDLSKVESTLHDVLCVGVTFSKEESTMLGFSFPEPVKRIPPALYRIQRHLAGAAQERAGLAEGDVTIVSPEHGVVHAPEGEGAAFGGNGLDRTVLERISRIEFNPEDDPSAQAIWDELWRSGYTITSMVERSGQRYVVLRASEGRRWTDAERAVLWAATESLSVKEIAHRLGLGTTTVSTHLARGLEKLGLRHRSEFIALQRGVR